MRALQPVGGGVASVALGRRPAPRQAPGEVIIAVESFSVNRGETFLLERRDPPHPGKDVAGRVQWVAEDVSGIEVGQRVVAHLDGAGWAELVAATPNQLAILPESVSYQAAAALPLAGLTALRLLRVCPPVAGRRLLLTGASGGVGHFFVELAAAHGCDITVVTGSIERAARLLVLGATRAVQSVDEVDGPFDIAIESVGGASLQAAWARLVPDGHMVWMGQASRTVPAFDFLDWRGATSGTLRRFHYAADPTPVADDLAVLVRLTAAGRLHPEIGLDDSWQRAPEAIAALLERRVLGNVVLSVDRSS